MQLKQLLISVGIAAALTTGIGVGTVASIKSEQVIETRAVSNGTPFLIQAKSAWDNVGQPYQLEFQSSNGQSKTKVNTERLWTYDNDAYHYYSYSSSDFSFTPYQVRAVVGSYSTKWLDIGTNFDTNFGTIWLDNNLTTGSSGGVYTKSSSDLMSLTITATFNMSAPEGQRVYIGTNLNNWSSFIELNPSNNRKTFTKTSYVSNGATVFSYKLLTVESGHEMAWDGSGGQVIKDNGSGGNASGSISNNASTLVSDDPYFDVTYYTITRTAVEFSGGSKTGTTWDLGNESIAEGETYTPSTPYTHLEHFVGWFTNNNCTTPYSSSAVNSNLSLYAKYELLSVDSCIYWTNKESGDFTNIYFFNEYAPTAWPGAALSTYLVSSTLYYNGEAKLYRIPCPSTGSFKMVLNSGNDNVKTYDITVVPGSLYYTWYDENYSSGTYWYNSSSVDATAAALVADIEISRNDVVTEAGHLQYSICGIAAATAQGYYNRYYAMTSAQKNSVDASYTYTYSGSYNGVDVPSETNINFDEIMLSLKKVATDAGLSVSGSNKLSTIINGGTDTTTMVVIAISASLIAGLGLFFFIRKKKAQ